MSVQVDEAKLEAFAGKVMEDVAGAMGLFMAYIGDQAGVYEAIDKLGPISCDQLAEQMNLNVRYLREWLSANAAAGYVSYDPDAETFWLTEEQALVMTREGQPACMQGFFQSVLSAIETNDQAVETFKSGAGRPWSDMSPKCFCGTDRFFRPGYEANLLDSWIPALEGVRGKLEAGAKVADIGCGFGTSTVLMARAFPKSQFVGFDFHEPSIDAARKQAAQEGVTNVEFQVSTAKEFGGEDYDFACIFDALHDMGDPVGAAKHIKSAMKQDGTFMLVEPLAGDTLSDNMHTLGRIFYGFSTVGCVPASLAQEVGLGLGAQAGQKRLTDVLNQAGFTHVRRAAETGSNMVLEVRC